MGLKLVDTNDNFIYDEEWQVGEEEWTSQTIPDGHEIIGMKWRYNHATNSIWRLVFLLWKRGY